MDKTPILQLQSKLPFDKVFVRVLNFHLSEDAKILDITPGGKYSWQAWLREEKQRKSTLFPHKKFRVFWVEENLSSYSYTKSMKEKYDAIFFDPPYIFGLEKSSDQRTEDYGGYNHSFEEIQTMFEKANLALPNVLKPQGKLFLKYTDVFSLQERRFYFLSPVWVKALSNFAVIDHYVIAHHHISPTAYQVKNRPCGIVNYTYLSVLEVK